MSFWDGAGSAIVSGVGSLLNGVWNNQMSMKENKELMRYQSELNQKAVDVANKFNSPIESMKRILEAGLNPNLVYGNGVTGNQSDSKSVNIPNRNPNLDTGLVQAVETYFRNQQISNENRLTDQQVKESLSRQALNQQKTISSMLSNTVKSKTMQQQISQVGANLEHTLQSIRESQQRTDESVQRTSNLKSLANLYQEQIRYWEAHADIEKDLRPKEIKAHIHQMQESGNLSIEQQKVARSLVGLNNAKVDQIMHMIDYIDLQAGNEAIEYEINKRMSEMGMEGIKPKDLLLFLKDVVMSVIKGN